MRLKVRPTGSRPWWHCRARGRSAGIDPERARAGYKALHEYVQGQMAGAAHPPEGMFGGFLRQC